MCARDRGSYKLFINMTEDTPGLSTFHKVREQCEQANAPAWRAFLTLYSPLGLHLLGMYSPDRAAAFELWGKTVQSLAENNFERFRATARQSEREFLADVRALLLDIVAQEDGAQEDGAQDDGLGDANGAGGKTPDGDANTASKGIIDSERLATLLDGLPLLHQEMLWFKLAGYSDGSLEKMLRVAPRVAEAAFARLLPDWGAALKIEQDRCPWPEDWLALLRQARTAKKESCPELHLILRVHDGQVSWYDKEPVEKHVSGCVCCLERWTALREVGYWRRVAPAVSPAQIEDWLRMLPLRAEEKKSLLRRVFG